MYSELYTELKSHFFQLPVYAECLCTLYHREICRCPSTHVQMHVCHAARYLLKIGGQKQQRTTPQRNMYRKIRKKFSFIRRKIFNDKRANALVDALEIKSYKKTQRYAKNAQSYLSRVLSGSKCAQIVVFVSFFCGFGRLSTF